MRTSTNTSLTSLVSGREGRQLCLFENLETATRLNEMLWCGSFDRQKSSLQRLAPYNSQLQLNTIRTLLDLYSQPGQVVLDPFAGAGTIPLETALAERIAWANDRNPYACAITRGKLTAPKSERLAVQQAIAALQNLEQQASQVDLATIPSWVQEFFHPATLQEIVVALERLHQQENHFLIACLLGILHHIRPGFLSYPTAEEAPYLKRVTYPPERFPQMYAYRDVRSRLLAKIRRVYRQHWLPSTWNQQPFQVWQAPCQTLPIANATVDTILTSPPHSGAFSYICDHRLRLWFLGYHPWKELDAQLISGGKHYRSSMALCLQEMARVLKPGGYCIFLFNDVECHGKTRQTAEAIANLVATTPFIVETLYDHPILQGRMAQRGDRKLERILVLHKPNKYSN